MAQVSTDLDSSGMLIPIAGTKLEQKLKAKYYGVMCITKLGLFTMGAVNEKEHFEQLFEVLTWEEEINAKKLKASLSKFRKHLGIEST